jgi:hypothetical protein
MVEEVGVESGRFSPWAFRRGWVKRAKQSKSVERKKVDGVAALIKISQTVHNI